MSFLITDPYQKKSQGHIDHLMKIHQGYMEGIDIHLLQERNLKSI